jgi:hypothetical protein
VVKPAGQLSEAEYRALSDATREAMRLENLYDTLVGAAPRRKRASSDDSERAREATAEAALAPFERMAQKLATRGTVPPEFAEPEHKARKVAEAALGAAMIAIPTEDAKASKPLQKWGSGKAASATKRGVDVKKTDSAPAAPKSRQA